ncbi:delta-lactam-biosynthetic de-N-acetylase [Terrisporobacter mayombei]|uniref:Peptidoglycan-N-acetylmuramic acid deacetylase PdaA n=1 Tax=Terrisporobacter mayombei TaxID=1541 RepID=A0ABY9PXB1_9FIRM|nr:polysaccharide deacetylase family protein [Terrisporobacter mayombei]MCC3867890.1 polysaccharide deacetylase family protein [Terrisporobacter mayombei]WMT80024.1 Peptidoglycan-N-acetylmuramic acid deacetylase PdaA [Terrisporobacter mayombei]
MKKFVSILLLSSLCIPLFGFSKANTAVHNINSEKLEMKVMDLDNTCIDWFFIPNDKFRTPQINEELKFNLSDYDAFYNGPKQPNKKSLYLTFDEGYENGHTDQILDVLKEKNVKAIFFVTSHYITYSPDTVKRMVAEGHVVANHTNHHYSMPTVTYSSDAFNKELTDVENKFKELTGKDMPKFFRPPMGKYSQKSLAMTKDLGYKTIFWSFAYGDYEATNQPSPGYAKQHILGHLHEGSIILLHAISKTNADILGEIIDESRNNGYEFYLLP